jgi:hypothetical protein
VVDIEDLQLFGLNQSQCKLINFFIEHENKKGHGYKKIESWYKNKREINRQLLLTLIKHKYVYVLKDVRPFTYRFIPSKFGCGTNGEIAWNARSQWGHLQISRQ